MADSAVSEPLVVQSHAGPYAVEFDEDALAHAGGDGGEGRHYIVDARVAELYADELAGVLGSESVLLIEASEASKSLDLFSDYVEHLVARGIRRGHVLVAIGGGVIQDIVCFLAATLLRGLEWNFVPTTLLAQADSCIGSKSSINVRSIKNALGTFTPPSRIAIATRVLGSLDPTDVRSGVGEMLKVHAIDGPGSFDAIAADYDQLFDDGETLIRYIRRSLEIKRGIIEEDEFDRGVRNVMNYGHSFGHAIESATGFAVPHGIAITIGMDMANYAAVELGVTAREHFDRMHPTFARNYAGFEQVDIGVEPLLEALGKDKKNRGARLRLVLPGPDGVPALGDHENNDRFRAIIRAYLERERRQ